MKVYEVMRLSEKVLKILQSSCIHIEDVRYLQMYSDYQIMKEAGGKMSYIVATLVDTYQISERQVYYLVKKLSQDCNIGAV